MENYGILNVCWAHGYKGDEICHVDPDCICYTCGNTVKFHDVPNFMERSVSGEGNGVKKIATNPLHSLFAVAETGLNSRIFIYKYPSCEPVITLEDGAELEYTNLTFSYSGNLIAACSGLPDFTLFVWNWRTGELKCQEKLLSEEKITSMLFNPLNYHQLSVIGPTTATSWTLQECNNIATLQAKKIHLPTSDGVLLHEDDDTLPRSVTRAGYVISVPSAIKAGLSGDKVKDFLAPELRHPRVTPTSQCWSSRGDVYIGCEEGQLFKVDGENGHITMLLGGPSDNIRKGAMEPGMFYSMALNTQGLYGGGMDGCIRLFTIDNNGIAIEKVWKTRYPITTMSFSPKLFSNLVYGTNAGLVYLFNTVTKTGNLISETHVGQFVGISFGLGGKFCVTCREDGEVQLWENEGGFLVASLPLRTRVVSVAFCPSCPVIAVGTESGQIRYIDATSLATEEVDLRQIHSERMHHGPVDFLKYDNSGTVLLSGSSQENHIFIINAKPSAEFACIGYLDCKGAIKDITIQEQDELCNVAVVVASPVHNGEKTSSNTLVTFALPPLIVQASEEHFRSLRKNFKDAAIKCRRFNLSTSVDSAVVTNVGEKLELAALSSKSKKLLRFQLPLRKISQSQEEVLHRPLSEHPGHELGGGFLGLSLHGKWLASSSEDGVIMMRDLSNWDSCVTASAHSFIDGGTKQFAFSPDAKQIVTIGSGDSSLACFTWNFTDKGSIAANSAMEKARIYNMKLRSSMEAESDTLETMSEWSIGANAKKAAPEPVETSSEEKLEEEMERADTRPGSGIDSEIAMTPSPTPEDDATWLDNRIAIAVKEENAKYDEEKKKLRKRIKNLRKTILGLMETNNTLPEMEQLRHDEYNLDQDEQKRMQDDQDREVQDVRDEIELENLAQTYMAYLIKKECWEDMHTKGRALKSFNTNITVNNYPTKPTTSQEETLLLKITQIRKIEIQELLVRKVVVEATVSKTSATVEEEEEEEVEEKVVGLALHGSLGPKYSGDSELFYSQFEIHTREEKFAQIILLQDAIRRIKESFNEAFAGVFKNKEQEIARIKERNIRIRTIIKDLDLEGIMVADPTMDVDEMPEKSFVVSDEEVTVERVLSEEQEKEQEELEKFEEERKAAAKGDNKRERALVDMMNGVLEVKKEDILKQDLPPPDFVEEKLEKDWTDEEKKKVKEFEKKLKELHEEREKYRKNLENELKKLQASNAEGMTSFDDALTQLFNKKVKTEMVINQEELKILRLTCSIVVDDELFTHETHLNYMLKLKTEIQEKARLIEMEIRKRLEAFRDEYDNEVAEDKMLDRGFKREFSDVPLSISDQLYKLFRRRPRVQRHKNPEDKSATFDPYGLSDKGSSHPGDFEATLQALTELDNESHMPEGLDPLLWQRLCMTRREKVESELRVKQTANIFAEMTQYHQHRLEEFERLTRDIDDIIKQQTRLCEDSMKSTLNLEVQLLLKQGQVEVPCGQFIPDYSDSLLIHRAVVEDLNGTIRTLGESKVAAMTESKDFKKGIHQLEWDRKRMLMQMEDLHNRARHIQMLKLTKQLQAYLNEENQTAKQAKEIAILEQTLALLDKQLDKQIAQKSAITNQLTRKIRLKEHENKELDKVLEELHVSVSERQNIADVNATERAKNTADKRLRGIVQRRKLVDLAKAQAQEVAVLRAEVERLRMKTFPALVQVER